MANRIVTRGHTVDLYVRFSDANGDAINADATPSVEITDSNGTVVRALSSSGVSQETDSTGLYKLSYEVSLTLGVDGYHSDRWVAKIGGETVTATFSFLVQDGGTLVEAVDYVPTPGDDYVFTFTPEEVTGINILLKILKKRLKSDGVRKVPDGAGGYTTSSCAVFSTDELICFLINSLSEFNQWPHFTNFTFADSQIYGIFADVIIQGAVLLGLAAQALIEKGREFTIQDSGVSYQPPAVSDILNNQYTTQLAHYKEKLKAIKCSLKPSAKGLGTFRVTAISPAYMRLRHLRARQII